MRNFKFLSREQAEKVASYVFKINITQAFESNEREIKDLWKKIIWDGIDINNNSYNIKY